jgi:hypothetical protein
MSTTTQVRPPASARYEDFAEKQLALARRRIRFLDLASAGLVLATGALAYAVVMAILDRWLELPALTRQVAFTIGAVAAGIYAGIAIIRRLLQRINPYFAARHIERTLPEAKNSLVNWLDLRGQLSPGSIRSAVSHRAAKDLARADLDQAISARRTAWLGGGTLVLLGAVAVLFLQGPPQFYSLMRRAFAPFGGAALESRTRITVLQPVGGNATIPVGRTASFSIRVDGRIPDRDQPDAVKFHLRYQPDVPYEEREPEPGEIVGDYGVTVPAYEVHNGFFYKVTAGDAETPEYHIQVRATPLITDFDVTYHFRPYLNRGDEKSRDPNLEAVRGTEVTIVAHTNRQIKEGRLDIIDDRTIAAELLPGDPKALRFQFVIDHDGKYQVSFTARDGDKSGDTTPYTIKAIPDHEPIVELRKPGRDIVLPANGVLRLAGSATDDFGLTAMRLQLLVTRPPAQVFSYRLGKSFRLEDGSYPKRLDYQDFIELAKVKDSSGRGLQPGQVIEYWLEALDNCDYPDGKPHVGRTPRYKIQIVDPQEQKQEARDRQEAQQDKQNHERQQDQQLEGQDEKRPEQDKEAGQEKQDQAKKDQQQQKDKEKEGDKDKGNQGDKDKDLDSKAEQLSKAIQAQEKQNQDRSSSDQQKSGGGKEEKQSDKQSGKDGEQKDQEQKSGAGQGQKQSQDKAGQEGKQNGSAGAKKEDRGDQKSQPNEAGDKEREAGEQKSGDSKQAGKENETKDQGQRDQQQAGKDAQGKEESKRNDGDKSAADKAKDNGKEGMKEGQTNKGQESQNQGGAGEKKASADGKKQTGRQDQKADNQSGNATDEGDKNAEQKSTAANQGAKSGSQNKPGADRKKDSADGKKETGRGDQKADSQKTDSQSSKNEEGDKNTEQKSAAAKQGDKREVREAQGQDQQAGKPQGTEKSARDNKTEPGKDAKDGMKDKKQESGGNEAAQAGAKENEKKDSQRGAGEGKDNEKQAARKDGKRENGTGQPDNGDKGGQERAASTKGRDGKTDGKTVEKDITDQDVPELLRALKEGNASVRRETAEQLKDARDKIKDPKLRQAIDDAIKESGQLGKSEGRPGKLEQGRSADQKARESRGEKSDGKTGEQKADGAQQDAKRDSRDALQGQKSAGQQVGQEGMKGKESGQGNQQQAQGTSTNSSITGQRRGQATDPEADGKGSPADPRFQRKAGVLQLEDIKKHISKDVLKRANMTEEEYRQWLAAYQKKLEREGNQKGNEERLIDPRLTGTKGASRGARQVKSNSKEDRFQHASQTEPPPEYRDIYREFTEKLSGLPPEPGKDKK